MKKVYVNAQLTAFVSISEVLGFVVIFLITSITSSKTTGKVLFRLLECILLPYAFLKNTDENKQQVASVGWLTFFSNTFNVFNFSPPWWHANDVIILNQIENNSNDDIFVVSKTFLQNSLNNNFAKSGKVRSSYCNLHAPFDRTPSSSVNNNSVQNETEMCSDSIFASREKVVEWLNFNEKVLNNRSTLINELISSVSDELKYMNCFLQFIEIEDSRNETKYLHENPMIDNDIVVNRVKILLHKSDRQERISLRLRALQKLTHAINDEDRFQVVLSKFIDIEENLLKNKIEDM